MISQIQSAAATVHTDVLAALRTAAHKTGLDFDYLLSTAMRESKLDAQAKSKSSSASGLFQFIDQTWLGLVKKFGGTLALGVSIENPAVLVTAGSSAGAPAIPSVYNAAGASSAFATGVNVTTDRRPDVVAKVEGDLETRLDTGVPTTWSRPWRPRESTWVPTWARPPGRASPATSTCTRCRAGWGIPTS